jgi:hypothetical protein
MHTHIYTPQSECYFNLVIVKPCDYERKLKNNRTFSNILLKDKDNRIYETSTMDALAEVVQLLDPTYELIQK